MSLVLDAIAAHAISRPQSIALQDERTSLTYASLAGMIGQVADHIGAMVPGNSPVASLMDNSVACAVLDLALVRLGRVSVPLPPFFSAQQREHALAASGAGLLITFDELAPKQLDIAGIRLAAFPLSHAAVPLHSGTAKITFTSGTTGAPKGVCLSQHMMDETAAAIFEAVGAAHGRMHCACLPHAVLLENVAGLYAVMVAGGTYCSPSLSDLGFAKPFAPDFLRFADALGSLGATSIILVPELLRGLMAALTMKKSKLPSLSFAAVGGSSVSEHLLKQAAALGLPVFQGYGLSEAGSVVSLNTHGNNRPGTAGHFLRNVEAEVSSDGELLLTKPVFLGYAGGQAAPSVLATGDVVSFDDAGHVTILGRKSDVIITAYGRNVSPEWVERELLSQSMIRQALVYGEAAHSLSALIVPVGASVSSQQIEAAIAAADLVLPEYARVKRWHLVEPFTPFNGQLTANGRLRRDAIRQAYSGLLESTDEKEIA